MTRPPLRSSARAALPAALVACMVWSGAPRVGRAQAPTGRPAATDTTRRPTPAPAPTGPRLPVPPRAAGRDSAARDSSTAAAGPRRTRAAVAPRPGLEPPITPRRAFLTSLLVPGLGQSRLERPSAGAGFFLVEMGALAMLQKSVRDLREVKALRADSIPSSYPVDPTTGEPTGTVTFVPSYYTAELERARRLHVEDWIFTLVFNHLLAGAEAYVAANLWDVPAQVSVRDVDGGRRALVLSLAW